MPGGIMGEWWMMFTRHLFFVLVLCLGFSSLSNAAEFRSFRPILTHASMPPGALAPADMKPVSHKLIGKAVDKVVAAWNANNVDSVLGKDFYDKSRLNDAMNSKVPRDAQLSVLGIQRAQTLSQSTADSPSGKLLVSMVSVTVKTQLTFNDPVNGYQRREGTNEYIMRIKQRAPR